MNFDYHVCNGSLLLPYSLTISSRHSHSENDLRMDKNISCPLIKVSSVF